jgi:uncharacterized membrane protein YhaH (DUF805 family)
MKPSSAGIMTLLAMAGRASRSKNWLMLLALAMVSAHFLVSGLNVEVSAPLAVAMLEGSTFA